MADFSTILQSPDIRALVQENMLERAFHDALFPKQLFRESVTPVEWPANVGDTMVFTGNGLIQPSMRLLTPGTDPTPTTFTSEQWTAQLGQLAQTIDTHMPTSIVAIASLLMRNAQQLGMSAGQSLNRKARNAMYNAALSGWTVADGAQVATTTLRVKRLNGFTRARRPDLVGGSPVKFETVSAANPLSITVFDTTGPAEVTRTVVGFTADNPGDEIGPGTLTLNSAVSVADRAYVFSSDRTAMVRVGGGNSIDSIGAGDIATLAMIRAMVARFRQMNVPEMPDGTYHMHVDPTTENQLFADPEFQRLYRSLPDSEAYKQFTIGRILGVTLFRNTECPQTDTVVGGATASYSLDDTFGGELYANGATSGVQVHRPLLVGAAGCFEYYQNLNALITEAGLLGKVTTSSIVNNGIEVNTDRIQFLIRAPMNRLQDLVSTTWKWIGDYPVRTDVATGDSSRYKRVMVSETGS